MIESIPGTVKINNVLLINHELKDTLLPSPIKCLKVISEVLPEVAHDKNELLLSEIQVWTRILSSPAQSVEGFVEFLVWLEHGKCI
jgi:dynein heavy chain